MKNLKSPTISMPVIVPKKIKTKININNEEYTKKYEKNLKNNSEKNLESILITKSKSIKNPINVFKTPIIVKEYSLDKFLFHRKDKDSNTEKNNLKTVKIITENLNKNLINNICSENYIFPTLTSNLFLISFKNRNILL